MQLRSTDSVDEARAWLADRERFDVAVVDVDAVDRCAAALADCGPAVIALSGLGRRAGARADGFAGWLTRPVRRSQLRTTLRGALGSPGLAVPPAVPEPTPSGRGLHVLVAEDNPVNQRVVLLFLEKLGHRADVVADGRGALEALERGRYDVVLMDMQMPDVDGLEATRLIRARHRERSCRIIAVTANAIAGDRELCLAAGMDDYLSKPFSIDELAHALAQPAAVSRP
jgi:CheY-like chemotaxis protein